MEYTKDIKELIKEYQTNQEMGLTAQGVKQNLDRYGENILIKKKKKKLFFVFFDNLKEPMMLILLIALLFTLIISIVDIFRYDIIDFKETYGIVFSILLSSFINIWMEGKSRKAFDSLLSMQNHGTVVVIRENQKQVVESTALAVGDIVVITTGDKVFADGRILESNELEMNESSLTGETNSILKSNAEIREQTTLAERHNMVYSGTYVVGGNGRFLVTQTGYKTELGKIADTLKEEIEDNTPLEKQLKHLSKVLVIIGVVVAIIMFLLSLIQAIRSNNFSATLLNDIFITSTIYIVSAVPEGLPGIVAISLAINVVKMSKQNALVKKMVAVETIGRVNVICSDKTGTLTQNQMTVSEVYENHFLSKNKPRNLHLRNNLLYNNSVIFSFKNNQKHYAGNPTECAILSFMQERDEKKEISKKIITPFSSETKYMETELNGYVYLKGGPEVVLKKTSLPIPNQNKILTEIDVLQLKGERVIAFGSRRKTDSFYQFDGFISMVDPIKPEVYDAVLEAKEAKIQIIVITGDSKNTAFAVCNKLQLMEKESLIISGEEIDEMGSKELEKKIKKLVCIYRATPKTKLKIVKLLKKLNHIVAMTGDGINDALALKEADVGLAMGITGTEVAKEASDIVLLDDSFSTILKAIGFGRNIYENFKRFIVFQLTVNISSIILIICSILLGFASPFTALELLWINIIMDGPPALALGTEESKTEKLEELKFNRNDKILSKRMIYKIALSAIVISLLCIFQSMFNYIGGTPEEQHSILFSLFVIMEMLNIFNIIHGKINIFKQGILLLAIILTLGVQVIIVNYANGFFDLSPLSLEIWIKMYVVGIFSFLIIRLLQFKKKRIKSFS